MGDDNILYISSQAAFTVLGLDCFWNRKSARRRPHCDMKWVTLSIWREGTVILGHLYRSGGLSERKCRRLSLQYFLWDGQSFCWHWVPQYLKGKYIDKWIWKRYVTCRRLGNNSNGRITWLLFESSVCDWDVTNECVQCSTVHINDGRDQSTHLTSWHLPHILNSLSSFSIFVHGG